VPVKGKGYTLDTVFLWMKDWTEEGSQKSLGDPKRAGIL
jgi:hypothetical protein